MTPDTLLGRWSSKVQVLSNGCWEWTACKDECGYGHLGANGVVKRAHRVAWELFNGVIPDGLCVLHHCDNPGCVRPSHLFLGTKGDNNRDRDTKGRLPSHIGEANPCARLTYAQVCRIRASCLSQRKLAMTYGVAQSTISAIKTRRTWR